MKKVDLREAVTFNNKGEKIFGILHRPPNSETGPAILICGGLGGSKCGKGDFYVHLSQELVRSGFTVLRFDYRGSGDSEGDSETITLEDRVDDVIVALRFLEQDSRIDASRIGVLGRSLGGAAAVLAAQSYPHIKSFVLWAPVYSGKQWLDIWKLSQQAKMASKISPEQAAQIKAFSEKSPNEIFSKQLVHVDLEKCMPIFQNIPLLHLQGLLDVDVTLAHADSYEQACRNFKKVKFIRLPQTDHDFTSSPERGIIVQETCEWFKKTLM